MADQVPDAVKAERLARLQALLDAQQRAFNRACVGAGVPVLFERPGRHAGPAGRPQPLSAGGACRGARRDRSARSCEVEIDGGHAEQPGAARCAGRPRPRRRRSRQRSAALELDAGRQRPAAGPSAVRRQRAAAAAVRRARPQSGADRAEARRVAGARAAIWSPSPASATRSTAARTALDALYDRLEARPDGRPPPRSMPQCAWPAPTTARSSRSVGAARRRAASRDPHAQAHDHRRARRRRRPISRRCSEHELVFGLGPAGTGKTYLAVAVGGRAC